MEPEALRIDLRHAEGIVTGIVTWLIHERRIVEAILFSIPVCHNSAMRLTNTELCARARHAAEDLSTLFVMGAYGSRLTASEKERLIEAYAYNQKPERREMILAADESVFAFDCSGFVKGLLWGFEGRSDHPYGGAEKDSNEVPDHWSDEFFSHCTSKSDKFLHLVPGEMLWLHCHCGIYIGDGLAAECSPSFHNRVQITSVLHPRKGYMTRYWAMHGFLPYVDYKD